MNLYSHPLHPWEVHCIGVGSMPTAISTFSSLLICLIHNTNNTTAKHPVFWTKQMHCDPSTLECCGNSDLYLTTTFSPFLHRSINGFLILILLWILGSMDSTLKMTCLPFHMNLFYQHMTTSELFSNSSKMTFVFEKLDLNSHHLFHGSCSGIHFWYKTTRQKPNLFLSQPKTFPC